MHCWFLLGRPSLLEVPGECSASVVIVLNAVGIFLRSSVGVSGVVGSGLRNKTELTDDESVIPDTTVWC
jgi:hypothetical protein